MIKTTSTFAPVISTGSINPTSVSDQLTTPILKKCCKCGQMLPLSEFEQHNKARDGHRRICKACNSHKKEKKLKEGVRPPQYAPQPGNKATLTLADFTDENIFAELRRRGYNGSLRYSKVINV